MKYLLSVLLQVGCVWTIGALAGGEESHWTDRLGFSGWMEVIQSIRIRSPHDSLTSRARLRPEFSADVEKNRKMSPETGIDLHEALLEHADGDWDIPIGRQIIIRGRADGIQVTDIISPPEYSESITRDLDDIRMPVDATKVRLPGD